MNLHRSTSLNLEVLKKKAHLDMIIIGGQIKGYFWFKIGVEP